MGWGGNVMSVEEYKDTVLKFYESFDHANLELARELVGANFIAHLPQTPQSLNLDAFLEYGLAFRSAFDNAQHKFDNIIVAEDKIITSGTFSGIHTGELQGLPPTGKQVKFSVMHIDRLENGKIVEHWGIGDALGLMQQIGVIPIPGLMLFSQMIKSLPARLFQKLTSGFGNPKYR